MLPCYGKRQLSVKSLLEKSCFETIDEQCKELQNFLAVIEHVLSHRLRAYQTWFGSDEPRYFWDFIKAACKKVPHNCLSNILSLEYPKTGRGKGRAWLRSALMEKRLSEYLSAALQQSTLLSRLYQDGSIMLTEEANTLCGILLGLNSIDFSFDIRGSNLDFASMPVIDYSPYLKFHQRPEDEIDGEEISEESGDTWKEKYLRLDCQLKVLCEQKGYLEELVRLRETQLEEAHSQRQQLVETLQHYKGESRRERHQLETVIIELQTQLRHMKDDHSLETQKMEIMLLRSKNKPPAIALSNFVTDTLSERDSHGSNEGFLMSSTSPTPSPSKMSASRAGFRVPGDGKSLTSLDNRSIISANSSTSATKDDSQSMIVMAGSFTSQTSKMSDASGNPLVTGPAGDARELANQKSPLAARPPSAARELPGESGETVAMATEKFTSQKSSEAEAVDLVVVDSHAGTANQDGGHASGDQTVANQSAAQMESSTEAENRDVEATADNTTLS